MKILHVIPGLGSGQGGLGSALRLICDAQARAGLAPEVATLHEADAEIPGIPTHMFKAAWRMIGASPAMRTWLRSRVADYDAVVAHSIWREPFLYAAAACRASTVPLVVVAHGMLDQEALSHRAWRKRLYQHRGVHAALKQAHQVFTCRAEMESAEAPAGQGRHVIPLPVAVPAATALARDGGPIVCVGRIHPRKGLATWVEALRLLRDEGVDFTAVHAGPTEDRRHARALRKAGGDLLTRNLLRFRGALDREGVQALLASARLVIAPFAVRENFGLAMVEAMALGKPVVAGRRGLLVSELEAAGAVIGCEHDGRSMADAIRGILADDARREHIAGAGRDYVARFFAPEIVGRAWRDLVGTLSKELLGLTRADFSGNV